MHQVVHCAFTELQGAARGDRGPWEAQRPRCAADLTTLGTLVCGSGLGVLRCCRFSSTPAPQGSEVRRSYPRWHGAAYGKAGHGQAAGPD